MCVGMEMDLDITPHPDLGPRYLSTFYFQSGVKIMLGMTMALRDYRPY